MSNIYQLDHRERRYDEASSWMARVDKGISEAECEDLRQWLADSEENRALFLKMAEIWDKMEVLSKLADLFPQPVKSTSGFRWLSPALAASVVVVALAGLWALVNFTPSPSVELTSGVQGVYKTAIGEHSTINLPDGTQLVLNTNTLVKVKYSVRRRVLELERGELHVDVAHDPSRPLSVIAGDQVFQAIGTAFNIELHSDQRIELVVTEGKVQVGVHHRRSTHGPAQKSSVTVSQGQQLLLGEADERIEIIEPEEIAVKLSWRKGNLIFRGEPLEEAIAEISRYTSVEFVFLDENLKKVKVAGLFKAGDVNGLLATLRENFNITYQRLDEKVLLGSQ